MVRISTRLALGAGRVFLNNSRASSSFKILMVSEMAASSSVRVLTRSAYSSSFVLQPFSSSASIFLSSSSAASVSDWSPFMVTMDTPSSPTFSVLDSTDDVRASISFFLAAMRASNSSMALFSAAVASARDLLMESPICLRMPVISPLAGTYLPLRNDRTFSLSWSSMLSVLLLCRIFFRTCTVVVCRKLPAMPFSIAETALVMALMYSSSSAFSEAYEAASFSRTPFADAMAALASARSL